MFNDHLSLHYLCLHVLTADAINNFKRVNIFLTSQFPVIEN